MSLGLNPLDWRTVLLAKHAQHVVLIHFPIALYITGVTANLVARFSKRDEFTSLGYWNITLAAVFTIPVLATGIMAWQWQLEGQKLKGLLLYHMVLAWLTGAVIVMSWLLEFRARRKGLRESSFAGTSLQLAGVMLLALTAHLGGFLSGVNGAP